MSVLRRARKAAVAAAALATTVSVTTIDVSGWKVLHSSLSVVRPNDSVTLWRQGFSSDAKPTVVRETLTIPTRAKQIFPNDALYDPRFAALSDMVLATDAPAGNFVNQSAEISPLPIAKWLYPDLYCVGNLIPREYLAISGSHYFARNGEEFAAVVWTITDGTNTVTAISGQSEVLVTAKDPRPMVAYMPPAGLDISSLAEGSWVIQAKVYPKIGGAASVADSSVNTVGTRTFCGQRFMKNVARATNPPIAYFATSAGGGVDGTVNALGQLTTDTTKQKVSTNDTTAKANAFQTYNSALLALRTASGISGPANDVAGCIIRMKDSNTLGSGTAGTYNVSTAELILEPDPSAAAGSITITLPGAWAPMVRYLRIRNHRLLRTAAAGQIKMGLSGTVTWGTLENCSYDGPSNSGVFSGAAAGFPVIGRIYGLTLSGVAAAYNAFFSAVVSTGSLNEWHLLRGISGGDKAYLGILDNFCIVATDLANAQASCSGTSDDGMFIGFSRLHSYNTASSPQFSARSVAGNTSTGMGLVQSIFECITATPTTGVACLRPSGDSDLSSILHMCIHNCTFSGYQNFGRWNAFYEDNQTYGRTYKFISVVACILVSLNSKGSSFVCRDGNGNANPTVGVTRLGNQPFLHGVGCRGNLVQYPDGQSFPNGNGGWNGSASTSGYFSQIFAGPGSINGTAATPIVPMFVSPQHTTAGPTAGAGNGNHRLLAGSPAAGLVFSPVLRFDADGLERLAVNDAAGAYRAAA